MASKYLLDCKVHFIKQIIPYIAVAVLLFFLVPMAQITMRYLPYNTDVGFLQIKQQYIHIDGWRIAFFVHVYTSMFVLLAGFTQFSNYFLKHYKHWHRVLGKAYVINILAITGPASFIMALYANGGTTSRIAFVLLSILWWWFTYKALVLVKQKKFQQHRIFMIRSFALTLSAITLRCWKVILSSNFELGPMDEYRIIAWLGWGLNLLIAELYIRFILKKPIT